MVLVACDVWVDVENVHRSTPAVRFVNHEERKARAERHRHGASAPQTQSEAALYSPVRPQDGLRLRLHRAAVSPRCLSRRSLGVLDLSEERRARDAIVRYAFAPGADNVELEDDHRAREVGVEMPFGGLLSVAGVDRVPVDALVVCEDLVGKPERADAAVGTLRWGEAVYVEVRILLHV